MFRYDAAHKVVVCQPCGSCIVPGRRSQEWHLRAEPHRLVGETLKTALQLLGSYELQTVVELKANKPRPDDACPAIEGLTCYDGYHCLYDGCMHGTRHLPKMKEHVSAIHRIKPAKHRHRPLWKKCTLQTYFTGRGRIDYFVVAESKKSQSSMFKPADEPGALSKPEHKLFAKLEKDYVTAKDDLEERAGVVQDFESKSERIPWLDTTRFAWYLALLKDEEIRASYKVPPKKTGEDVDAKDAALVRILAAAEAVFQEAYTLCSSRSPDRKMTQQRANILNEFYAGASGRAAGFRPHKNASTLVKYSTTLKQLLAYYYRVVYCEDGHFTRTAADQVLPRDTLQPTTQQTQAMDEIMAALGHNDDEEEGQAALKHAIRQLYLALICHVVGSTPFRSPVLSYCAMLSRKVRRQGQDQGRGTWEEPGNFNSHLSALTWSAQLLIFEHACSQASESEDEDEDQIPVILRKICQEFFQQLAETPFGYILQWRLYLFKVGKAAVTKYQARWSLDGQMVEYRGVELQMAHIPQLVLSEYQQARSLLYDELMFGVQDLTPMESWRLKDDLDLEDFGASWLSHPSNAELLEGVDLALFRHIQASAGLRAMFLTDGEDGGKILCPKATAIYEATAQAFLKHMLVLCQVPSGGPLREPELLSVTWYNTARLRHVLLWEKLVMIHTQYHKGQEQSGAYKDNIRFLPPAIGNLLLDFIACVMPLRQLFLRQQRPGALLSPYLWAKLDGTAWPDGTVSTCLSKACARARVPRLHTSNWRQFATTICKEKFSAKERANFDLDDGMADEDVEDEQDLVVLAEQSNHSYHTFNHAYAGTTTLTMTSLLHRNYRASESWRAFFRFDHLLHGKRPRDSSGTPSLRMLNAVKRSRQRRKGGYSETDLLAVARQMYNIPDMQFRAPGQRDGLLAVMGPRSAEQVILVLATGTGKTLIFQVGTMLADARTTILILPAVILRGDMLRRCHLVGIRPLVWSIDCKQTASLVMVSAEAACTQKFLEYAQGLVYRQQLDRIVVDEAQLTITANDYRWCMSQLGWYLRQIRTQTVWLTATLPPVMQEEFIHQNKLVRPRMVRESTNRANLRYLISLEDDDGSLVEKAASFARKLWSLAHLFDQARDKIIIYCRTRDEAGELRDLLKCHAYMSTSGTEDDKKAIISGWLCDRDQPVIVATSALGIGFDYPHVRWVIHVDAPDKMTDFSQESGRAGRDGRPATSLVMIRSRWRPQAGGNHNPDKQAMQLYLTQQYCCRGVLSQFLDQQSDWRWCMEGEEEPCQVCGKGHSQPRPPRLEFALPLPQGQSEFTGPGEVLRQDQLKDEVLDQYEKDLELLAGNCLYCRAAGRKFEHRPGSCSRRFDWIRAKSEALQSRKKQGREWIAQYMVCWKCYQPQSICRVADPEYEAETTCRFPDMVLPLCYGVFQRTEREAWFRRHFGRGFSTQEEYMLWLGERASLEGNECIQANCVAAKAMAEFG